MRVLTYSELKPVKGIPYTRKHILELEKRGQFPRRVRLGEASVAWVESEIDEWLEAKAAQRRPAGEAA